MKLLNILTIVSSLFLTFNLTAATADNAIPKKQHIQGAFAFPLDEHQVQVRVNVAPNALNQGEKSVTDIMKKMTVVICVEGDCHFATEGTGLGFFESKFPMPKLTKDNSFYALVVACSALGCDRNKLYVTLNYPDGKK